ncbi:MAG: tetraacyldisaccharide 4'-kinase [Nonlabens sp.]|uniref:tetraacyldisaccharide 4'-kinase n=1 Tax=Nonlabens sp. TaxID=1888209 RepID=UPI00321B68C4
MQELRLLLYPFSIIYDGITSLRNWAFDSGILDQQEFDVPIIAVGNLSTGGTGKTPMIEYLINQHVEKRIAVLSRGYGRKTSGYIELSVDDSPEKVGDEPLQIKRKFKDLIISAVCEKRVDGIKRLLKDHSIDLILLDDAYQHRHVKASHYILLTSYNSLYVHDYLLPAGNLRESRSAANRAQSVVVTKCPENISKTERIAIEQRLKLSLNQKLYFSFIGYGNILHGINENIHLADIEGQEVTVVTGIAKPKPFVDFLVKQLKVDHLEFNDHHDFTTAQVENIRNKKLVITTEKDFMRLKSYRLTNLFYLSIETRFIDSSPVLQNLII